MTRQTLFDSLAKELLALDRRLSRSLLSMASLENMQPRHNRLTKTFQSITVESTKHLVRGMKTAYRPLFCSLHFFCTCLSIKTMSAVFLLWLQVTFCCNFLCYYQDYFSVRCKLGFWLEWSMVMPE